MIDTAKKVKPPKPAKEQKHPYVTEDTEIRGAPKRIQDDDDYEGKRAGS